MEMKTLTSHIKSCQKIRESTLLINNSLFGYRRKNIKNSWDLLLQRIAERFHYTLLLEINWKKKIEC